jgi:hypothetical protein
VKLTKKHERFYIHQIFKNRTFTFSTTFHVEMVSERIQTLGLAPENKEHSHVENKKKQGGFHCNICTHLRKQKHM